MTPYYADDSVTLYLGDAAEVLADLDIEAQVLLTDPPYFQVKDDEWDRQWKQADQFLDWLGGIVDQALPLLAPSATTWVFAGPALATRVEREVVAPRLRVLNSVRWVKEAGWHQKADIPAQRRYLTAWEGVILAERDRTFAPFGAYIQQERERAGWDRNDVDVALGYVRTANPARGTELCRRWEEGSSIPTAEAYALVRKALGTGFLMRRYDELQREFDTERRPFFLTRRGPVTDVWDFKPVMAYPGKHPCEKPLAMLLHMIETTSRTGDLILDPFAGSGSTADAARACGRRALLIEKDERYCAAIASRLSQGDLFEGIGA